MKSLWYDHENLFYWGWLLLWMLRGIANYQIYAKRGENVMDAYKPTAFFHPKKSKASLLIYFTFYFAPNKNDSHVLQQQVFLVNLLHFFFIIYTACLVLLGWLY